MKRTTLDSIFSELIRERDEWTCRHCHRQLERHQMQCAHIVSRKIMRLRHDPINAMCLCAGCHAWFTDRPTAWGSFVEREIGREKVEIIHELANLIHKRRKGWEKDARKHYRAELAAMKEKRMNGKRGRINFAGYW